MASPLRRATIAIVALAALPPLAGSAAAQPLYVTNFHSSTIERFTAAGDGAQFTSSGLSGPTGLAFDGAGDLFVANSGVNGYIEEYASQNGALSPAGTRFAGGLDGPLGLAFDGAGDLFGANMGNASIEEYAFQNGALSSSGTQFARSQAAGGDLDLPNSLALDRAGDLFVTDAGTAVPGSGYIEEYAYRNGSLSGSGTRFAGGLYQPQGLAFDSAGDLFVVNSGYNTPASIEEYDFRNGALSSSGTQFVGGLGDPNGLAFDGAGDLFVADADNNTIEEFASQNGALSSSGTQFAGASNGLNIPVSIAFAPNAAVPEPSPCALLGLGLVPVGSIARKRRRSA